MMRILLIALSGLIALDQALAESIEPPKSLEKWARELQSLDTSDERRTELHGLQAAEALRRSRKYIDGWTPHFDPSTGLVPRNLEDSKSLWNGKDSAADNYSFMVLTASLTDKGLYRGSMLEILQTERSIATQASGLPADYDFNKQDFVYYPQPLNELIFGGSEYVKDGLMPITEWLGETPWSDRMIEIVDSILAQSKFETPFGKIPSNNIEVNGEMMQVLSRLYFRHNKKEYLDMACRIADYYLLGDQHPTRDANKLELKDHNCELISGLSEVYAACAFARKEKAREYRDPIHRMLDDILRVGVNEHGLMFRTVNPKTGEILNKKIHDNWGYTYNAFYTVYLIDGTERYRRACLKPLQHLKEHYWEYPWQGWSSDGIADSVEGCINLYNREPDAPGRVLDWIDANMNRMLNLQQPDGLVEGWHGDGNYARTAIMWALMKQQGLTVQPWRPDLRLGAVRQYDTLMFTLSADTEWEGVVRFDSQRHREIMNLPLDYPRINQFPEWYTVDPAKQYAVKNQKISGASLIAGLPMSLKAGESKTSKVKED